MSTNHYFNNANARNEQNIIEDLTIESIKIHGFDFYYLKRSLINEDKIFGEDTISKFTSSKPIEMYIETVNGFGGQGDLLSKFGLQVKDTATFVVSKKRFQKETEMDRPLEGDIIYLPMTQGMFEIKFVEHENPFYQLGKNHTFKLSVELFQFSEEEFVTGVPEIDQIALGAEYNVYLTVTGGAGSFAVGDTVYQFTNGSATGSTASADCSARVESTTGTLVTLRKTAGLWQASDTITRYVTKDNSNYKVVSGISDKIDASAYDNNSIIQTQGDIDLDFSIRNPFGDA